MGFLTQFPLFVYYPPKISIDFMQLALGEKESSFLVLLGLGKDGIGIIPARIFGLSRAVVTHEIVLSVITHENPCP